MRAGDTAARETLAESQIPLVISIAKRMARPGDDLEELGAVGTVGLVRAINDFDPETYGTRLTTYAYRPIHQEIGAYQRRYRGALTRPYNRSKRFPEAWDRAGCPASELRGDAGRLDESAAGQDPAEAAARREELAALHAAIAQLPQREAEVIRRRTAGDTLLEVSRRIGVTRERVRQIELRAHERLRDLVSR